MQKTLAMFTFPNDSPFILFLFQVNLRGSNQAVSADVITCHVLPKLA
ncbi:hypothetical protein P879_11298 [Paragonimus westermani]|uniref:Uncharacterized protein n=1 Tax=Paragonimus westermani TaxID=34504 RepID=A0A8T0D7A8_9TREM|nr:hypothetical protein P879_11298 [Paragonimus westermani]